MDMVSWSSMARLFAVWFPFLECSKAPQKQIIERDIGPRVGHSISRLSGWRNGLYEEGLTWTCVNSEWPGMGTCASLGPSVLASENSERIMPCQRQPRHKS
jgi:hypothetical protein